MIDRLTEIGRYYGMEGIKGNENLKATIPSRDYDRSKAIGECGTFQIFG
jgi:hypothetical protein